MQPDESTRLELRQCLLDTVGDRATELLMESLPPVDYDRVATRDDVSLVRDEVERVRNALEAKVDISSAALRDDFAALRVEFADVKTDLGAVRNGLDALDTRLTGQIETLDTRLTGQISQLSADVKLANARLMWLFVVALVTVVASVVVTSVS
jgi:hypothetical protein